MITTTGPDRVVAMRDTAARVPDGRDGIRLPRILIVEDDAVIAQDIAAAFGEIGAEVIGPADSVQSALRLIDDIEIDGAVLDVQTRGDLALPLADQLSTRRIPFVFATGIVQDLPERFRDVRVWSKPFDVDLMARDVVRCCGGS